MISIWYQNLNQNAEQPEPSNMFHLMEFKEEQEALEWSARLDTEIKIKRITSENLHFAVRMATTGIMGGSNIKNHENKGEEKII